VPLLGLAHLVFSLTERAARRALAAGEKAPNLLAGHHAGRPARAVADLTDVQQTLLRLLGVPATAYAALDACSEARIDWCEIHGGIEWGGASILQRRCRRGQCVKEVTSMTSVPDVLLTRRQVVRWLGLLGSLGAAAPLLAACGGTATLGATNSGASTASVAAATASSPAASASLAARTTSAASSSAAVATTGAVTSASATSLTSASSSSTASVAAAASAPAKATLQLSFLNWYTASVVGADTQKVLEDLLKTYQQRTGTAAASVGVGFSDVQQKFVAGVAGNDPPDASFSSIIWGRDWYDQGLLADLDAMIAQAPDVQDDQFFAASQQFRQTRGHTFGLPVMGPESLIAWLDQNKVQAAGFDPEGKDIKTWDDLARNAQKLTKAGADGKIGVAGLSTTGSLGLDWLTAWTETTGRSLFDAEQNTAYYNAPETVAAVQFLVDLANKDNVAPLPTEKARPANLASVGQGKAAMALDETEPGDQFQYAGAKLWMIPLPGAPTPQGQAATATWLNFMVIPKSGKHNADAFQLIRFLAGLEAQLQLELQPPTLPNLAPRLDFYATSQWKQALAQHPNLAAAAAIAKLPGVYPYHKYTDQSKQIGPLLQQAYTGQIEVKTALDQAQQLANQLLAPK
jgi:ABC-type glycerol-3-phosphate transport system substrate-binding protein